MITCPVCNSTLDEMGHPQVKCPNCGTIIDTNLSPGAPDRRPQGYPPRPGTIPGSQTHMPSSYIAPPGFHGSHTIQHAGLLKRAVAFIIDFLIIGVITSPFSVLFFGVPSLDEPINLDSLFSMETLLQSLLALAISLPYFIYLEGSRQQTIGKMALDIIVVKEDLTSIDFNESYVRNGVRFLYEIPLIQFVIYFIDAVLIYSDDQRIGDKFAHTYVVEKSFFDYTNVQARLSQPMTRPPERPDDY